VGRAEQADPPGRPFLLHPAEVSLPADEVVDLEQVDPVAEPAELAAEVRPGLVDRSRPDLRRDERRRAAGPALAAERGREHRLRAAVHRRGIDDADATLERGPHDSIRVGLSNRGQVEHPPRAQSDDRQLGSGRAEASSLDHPTAEAISVARSGITSRRRRHP
jgi:hypothetical protein